MDILIVTQTIDRNDPVLGFFHRWVEEFAKNYSKVTVICLNKGEYDLPENVKVLSLGKEEGLSRKGYRKRFFEYIRENKNSYDHVFVHMNQVYVLLGGLLWRMWGKKVGLWYMHKKVSISLRIALTIVNVVFTGSKESFRIKNEKVNVMGHGINVESFRPHVYVDNIAQRMVTIGRISPVKGYEVLIEAVRDLDVKLEIVGGPGTEDQVSYYEKLKKIVSDQGLEDKINFKGAVPHRDIPEILMGADLFINMSDTGSLDKAVLEAMASGVIPITSNEGVESALGDHAQMLMFKRGDSSDLKLKIEKVLSLRATEKQDLGARLRDIVLTKHNVVNLIKNISLVYKTKV